MERFLILPLLVAVSLFTTQVGAFGGGYRIDAEEWARPRHGERLAAHPVLREAVKAAGEKKRIVIRHGGGEQGQLWAGELRDWLVALGIPSSRLEIAPDGPADGAIELTIAP